MSDVPDNPASSDAQTAASPSSAPQDAQAAHREREHFFGAAKLVALLTLGSRVLGMVRDMTIVWLGAKWQNDAFQFAFALPNLFRRLFGEGALSAAFVPVFTETAEQGGQEKSRRLLANTMGLLAVFLVVLWAVVQLGFWLWMMASPERVDRRYQFQLTSIMLPYMVLVCLLAVGSAGLNCRGHFFYPAFAPILLNICMIAADGVAVLFWKGSLDAQLTTISASVTVAGVIQLGGVLWLLKRTGFPVMPRLFPLEPGVKKILTLLAPALLGAGFMAFSSFYDYLAGQFFSSNEFSGTIQIFGWELHRPLQQGVLVRVTAAQRLSQFPMGVLATSLGTAVFPLLSRYAARGDMDNLRESVNRALRLSIMEGLAAGVGLFILAGPIIRCMYHRGQFTGADADTAANILRMYVLGMWAACAYQIVSRTFYSMKDQKTPLRISCWMSGLYMVLVSTLIFIPGIRELAFGLTMTVTFSCNVLIQLYILRKRLGPIGGKKVLLSAARSAVCCTVMAAAVLGVEWLVAPWGNLAIVIICVPVGGAVFFLAARLMRIPELNELLGAMKSRKANKSADASAPAGE